MQEQWRVVAEYPNYEVSDLGRVRRLTTRNSAKAGQILRQHVATTGYMMLNLLNEQGRKHVTVHRLVAAAFIERQEGATEVNHIDADRTNSRRENLEWVTPSGNRLHAYKTGGLNAVGEKNGYAKLTEDRVRRIRSFGAVDRCLSRLLAEEMGVSPATVLDVARRRTWSHI